MARARGLWICFVLALTSPALAQTFTPARDELVSTRLVTVEQAEAWVEELLTLNPEIAGFEVPEPGHVVAVTASGATVDLYLDALVDRLSTPAAERSRILAEYEADVLAALADLDRTPEPDQAAILPILRHRDFLAAAAPAPRAGEASFDRPVHRPFAGDLEAFVAYDTPGGIGLMGKLSMGIDNLSDEEAFTLALSNLAARADGLAWDEHDGVRYAALGGKYESSLLLLPHVWDALEAEIGGPPAVAVPTRSIVAAVRADDVEGVARLRALIGEATFDPLAVSEDVFVRRGGGWAVLEP